MGRIAVLPRAVADQIAAGEVVERVASVVKELVENALDAGATSVTVELVDGGRQLIRVSDDGTGMDREDAPLALERHATSKIRTSSDLIGVASYGFRGEALPAIASVSHLELETSAADSAGSVGALVRVKGGSREKIEEVARARGTTVTVKKLFYNTPARRKFLRSPRSETRAAVEALTVLALSRLDVAFKLISNGRVLLEAPLSSSMADRIASLFGRQLAEQLVPVQHAAGYVSVRGFVQRPADAKASGRKAYLFVNGRPFKDPFLVRAAEAGYRATIPPGLRPTILLDIAVPGDRVDVNVHPAKSEVRFRDKRFIEQAAEEAVRLGLGTTEAAAVVGSTGSVPRGGWYDSGIFRRSQRPAGAGDPSRSTRAEASGSGTAGLFAPVEDVWSQEILQLFNTYIVTQTSDGLAIVDQHSAHERVIYEEVMTQLRGEGSAAQRLLLPLTVDLNAEERDALEAHRELVAAVGYEVEPFGGSSVAVHAVPNPHPRFDAKRCFEELVSDLARNRFGALANRLERFAASYACRAAIKAGHALEPSEMKQLLRRLFACELSPHDVHGRPTIVQLPKSELDRRFGRT